MKFEQKEKIVTIVIVIVLLICFSLWDVYNILWIFRAIFAIISLFWIILLFDEKFSVISIWLIMIIVSGAISYILDTKLKIPDLAWEIWIWYVLSISWILLWRHVLKKLFTMKWRKPLIFSTLFTALVIILFLANNYWLPVFEYIWKAILFIALSIVALEGLYQILWLVYMIVVLPLAMLIQKLVWLFWTNISEKLSIVLSIVVLILTFLLIFVLIKNNNSTRECFDRTSIDWDFKNDMKCIDESGNIVRTDYEWARKLMWK